MRCICLRSAGFGKHSLHHREIAPQRVCSGRTRRAAVPGENPGSVFHSTPRQSVALDDLMQYLQNHQLTAIDRRAETGGSPVTAMSGGG